jgi:NAD(P)-dependent dehydrogenase (short-subunit alcohol dehydrogenase family)
MLFGKTVVVTGVASGIGAKVAELVAHLGAEVVGIDKREPPRGCGYDVVVGDLSTQSGIDDLLRRLPPRFDALCNVAGLSGKAGAVPTLSVNFFGLRYLSESVAGRINPGGSIVSVASIAGFGWRSNLARAATITDIAGFPDVAGIVEEYQVQGPQSYLLSKELLLVWTFRAAKAPLFRDRNIRVNAVSPGPVETPLLGEFRDVVGDAFIDADVARVGRSATPAEIAPPVAFLCSDGARWINGANIPVDGGWEATMNREVLGF